MARQDFETYYAKGLSDVANIHWSTMQKLARQKEFTSLHRQQQLKMFAATGKGDMLNEYESYKNSIAEKRASLQKKAYSPPIPEGADVAKLNYLSQALPMRWARMDTPAMRHAYQQAIEAADVETTLVYKDFADSWVAKNRPQKSAITGDRIAAINSPDLFKQLHERAQTELLTSKDAKKALDDLKQLDTEERELNAAKNHWVNTFDRFRMNDATGELSDANDIAILEMQERIRASF